MKVDFDKLDNVTGEITVTLEEKDYADKVEKQLKEISRRHSEPGFRQGHVPASLLKKKFGASVKYDVVNREIGEAVYSYIKENSLQVLGQPVPEEGNVFKDEEKDFSFKFKVGLAPEINDHVNKEMHVPYYTIKVTDEMVDDQIRGLRERMGRQVPGDVTEPNAVIKGEITELNPDGTEKEDGIKVENGIIAPIHFTDEEQKKLFEDKHPGDVVKFNPAATCNSNPTELSSMLNIDKNDVENHKGDFDFKIKEIIVLKPAELDQEFFDQAVGKDKAHNEEELKEELKKLMAVNLANDSDYRFTIDAKDAVIKAVGELELPEAILKDFLVKQGNGITKENVDEEFEKMKPQLTWDLTRDEIARRFNLKLEEADLMHEARGVVIRQLSQYSPNSLNENLIEHYAKDVVKDEKSREMLAQNAMNRKVFETIKQNVTLDGKEVSMEDFRKLFFAPQA